MNSPIIYDKLHNGIPVCIIPINSLVSTIALDICVGSKNDYIGKEGIAHFSEHMLFLKKGIKTNIISDKIDAFTTNEDTILISHILPNEFNSIIVTLYKMLFNENIYNENLVNDERNIILHELNSTKNIQSYGNSKMNSMLFGYQFGHSPLGTIKDINSICSNDIISFQNKYYISNNIQFVIMTNESPMIIIKLLNKTFGAIKRKEKEAGCQILNPCNKYRSFSLQKDNEYIYSMIGISIKHLDISKKIALALITHILGGKNNSSLLTKWLRDKYSISYNVSATYKDYTKFGSIFISYYCHKNNYETSVEYLKQSLLNLELTGIDNLETFKHSFIIDYSLENENRRSLIQKIIKWMTSGVYPTSLNQLIKSIDNFKKSDLQNIYNQHIRNIV